MVSELKETDVICTVFLIYNETIPLFIVVYSMYADISKMTLTNNLGDFIHNLFTFYQFNYHNYLSYHIYHFNW